MLVWMQNSVAPGSPKQVRASTGRRHPKLMTRKETVGQAEHTLAEGWNDCFGQLQFIDAVAVHAGGPQHVSAIFEQGHETDLGKGAGAAAGTGPAEGFFVFCGIGHIQGTSIQTDDPPLPVPGAFGFRLGDRSHDRIIQPLERLCAQAAARL